MAISYIVNECLYITIIITHTTFTYRTCLVAGMVIILMSGKEIHPLGPNRSPKLRVINKEWL